MIKAVTCNLERCNANHEGALATSVKRSPWSWGKWAIAVRDGDYYAYELIRALGLAESGGMVRVGFVHYNEPAEIERLAVALVEIATRTAAPSRSQS